MVILGATAPFLQLNYKDIEQTVTDTFLRKGQEVVDVNIACLNAGREFAMNKIIERKNPLCIYSGFFFKIYY
jgi:Pyruvate/2-oxoacid:ferredoxin oxidoreductase gamma subunit